MFLAAVVLGLAPEVAGAQEQPLADPVEQSAYQPADQSATEAATQAAVTPLATPLFGTATAADGLAPTISLDDRGRALACMSMAIAYEAAGQPVEGQQAVGQVILNRVRDPRFPKTVCGVVFQGSARATGCQFTFTCDGSFRRNLSDTTLITARSVAQTVLDGAAPDRVAGATHYHADYVLPYWAGSGQRVAKIGAHIFYRMPGDAAHGSSATLTRAEPVVPAFTRLSRRRRLPVMGPALAQATPVAAHSMFAPWGLPVAGATQH